jgi:hypothetical protein
LIRENHEIHENDNKVAFLRVVMNVVVISRALKRCRIMEPNSMNNDESVVYGFNYSDFEQILHGVFKKIERYRP